MTIKELLTQSKERIKDIRNWTRGSLVHVNDDGDLCFCARGALYDAACDGQLREIYNYHGNEYADLVKRPDVVEAEGFLNTCAAEIDPTIEHTPSPITRLNDRTMSREQAHANVLTAYDCAIEKAS